MVSVKWAISSWGHHLSVLTLGEHSLDIFAGKFALEAFYDDNTPGSYLTDRYESYIDLHILNSQHRLEPGASLVSFLKYAKLY